MNTKEIKNCETCTSFRQYYALEGKKFIRTSYGHCVHNDRKILQSSNCCDSWRKKAIIKNKTINDMLAEILNQMCIINASLNTQN